MVPLNVRVVFPQRISGHTDQLQLQTMYVGERNSLSPSLSLTHSLYLEKTFGLEGAARFRLGCCFKTLLLREMNAIEQSRNSPEKLSHPVAALPVSLGNLATRTFYTLYARTCIVTM
jgi:hypothetical protein